MSNPIGRQDGIAAFIGWLRKQPDVPKRGAGYDKADLSTWPWPDKLERTLKMLKDDHDAGVPNVPPLPPPPPPPPHPPPVSTLGLFNTRYGYVRDDQSGSETEKLDALKAAGYGGVALNVMDHPASEWGGWRSIAQARGLWTIPWGRCSTTDRIHMIRDIAEQWGSPGLIVNLEQEGDEPRWLMTGSQAAAELSGYTGKIGVSTEPVMPENFNWLPLIQLGAVVLPQSCVNEVPAFTPQFVVDRCKVFGWTLISPSFATYDTASGTPERGDYPWTGPFGIYTVDDLSQQEIPLWT